jgi:ferredoxin
MRIKGDPEYILHSGDYDHLHPRMVGFDEALTVLDKTHKAGLVHMALVKKDKSLDDPDWICSCCTCCCSPLSGVVRYGMAPHLLVSDTISTIDMSKCNFCGICENRCQFGAKEMIEGDLIFKSEKCLGCGLCVSTCPTNAITIIDKH